MEYNKDRPVETDDKKLKPETPAKKDDSWFEEMEELERQLDDNKVECKKCLREYVKTLSRCPFCMEPNEHVIEEKFEHGLDIAASSEKDKVNVIADDDNDIDGAKEDGSSLLKKRFGHVKKSWKNVDEKDVDGNDALTSDVAGKESHSAGLKTGIFISSGKNLLLLFILFMGIAMYIGTVSAYAANSIELQIIIAPLALGTIFILFASSEIIRAHRKIKPESAIIEMPAQSEEQPGKDDEDVAREAGSAAITSENLKVDISGILKTRTKAKPESTFECPLCATQVDVDAKSCPNPKCNALFED